MFLNTLSVHIPSPNLAKKANNTNNSFYCYFGVSLETFTKKEGGIKLKYLKILENSKTDAFN